MVGRQPIEGSKKRPKLKSLVIITRESTNTPHAQILKVGIDCNIFEIVANYTPVLVQDLYPQQQLKLKILTLQKPFKRAQIDQLKASHERFESLTK